MSISSSIYNYNFNSSYNLLKSPLLKSSAKRGRGSRRGSCNLSHKLRSVIKCKIFNCLQFVWRAGWQRGVGRGERVLRWAAHFHSCLHSVLATCWAAYIVHMLPLLELLLVLAERQSIRNTIKSSQSEKFYAARQSSTKKWRKKLPAKKKEKTLQTAKFAGAQLERSHSYLMGRRNHKSASTNNFVCHTLPWPLSHASYSYAAPSASLFEARLKNF